MRALAESETAKLRTVPLVELAEMKLGKMLDRSRHTSGHKLSLPAKCQPRKLTGTPTLFSLGADDTTLTREEP